MGYFDLVKEGFRNPSNVPDYLRRGFSQRTWKFWESIGFHLIPDHFYYPIPNLAGLKHKDWNQKYPTSGIDMNEPFQIELARRSSKYHSEYIKLQNPGPAPDGDGAVYYSLIRELEPNQIIEVGAGNSTNTALQALRKNENDCKITAVEPFPDDYLEKLEAENSNLTIRETKAEALDPQWYCRLDEGDILFIDSSHVIKVGNDVLHLFLRVIPQLATGVHVHIHDVKLPYEYSRERVIKKHRFWHERYLLHCFLLFNDNFEVIWGSKFMAEENREELIAHLPGYGVDDGCGGSFWMKRIE